MCAVRRAERSLFIEFIRAIAAQRSPSISSEPSTNAVPAFKSTGGVNALRNAPGELMQRTKLR